MFSNEIDDNVTFFSVDILMKNENHISRISSQYSRLYSLHVPSKTCLLVNCSLHSGTEQIRNGLQDFVNSSGK